MTANRKRKLRARQLASERDLPYTAARRAADAEDGAWWSPELAPPLLRDLDPQQNITMMMPFMSERGGEGKTTNAYTLGSITPGIVDLVRSGAAGAHADRTGVPAAVDLAVLKAVLKETAARFDFVVYDLPPASDRWLLDWDAKHLRSMTARPETLDALARASLRPSSNEAKPTTP